MSETNKNNSPFNDAEMAKYLKARRPVKDNAPAPVKSGLVTLSQAFKDMNNKDDKQEEKAEG